MFKTTLPLALALVGLPWAAQTDSPPLSRPMVGRDLVFEERDGLVAVEAEHFFEQTLTEKRAWYLTTRDQAPSVEPDEDPPHVAGASGGAYLEALPDTRHTHSDPLITGENFFPEPGRAAVLSYRIHFGRPGRYYVWVRAYSTGTEDNGLHVGLNSQWPASGQRMQWCDGKDSWRWESKQRTDQEHCGVPHAIYLDIPASGEHIVQFSLREDGFEFDKFILVNRPEYQPTGAGPAPIVKSGQMPPSFPLVAANKPFPSHWGPPPAIQTRDLRELPGGFGRGSSTLAAWIQANLEKDAAAAATKALVQPRFPDGTGGVTVTGDLKQWHKVTLTLDGPFAHERDLNPNPFTDYRFTVRFRHESGSPDYLVPGYFAADGNAGETSAESGTKWRAHLSPDKPGTWTYTVSFVRGPHAAVDDAAPVEKVTPFDGRTGTFTVGPTDKTGRDFRARGRLQYVGRHHLQFAGTQEFFLKAGADAPETLLAYADFDGTTSHKPAGTPARPGEAAPAGLKTWHPHVQDWKPDDPTWKDGKGKGLIGALNYLAGKGCNAVSFLTYNAGGDGDNVWPFVARDAKLNYDCSKLDQWEVVFAHAQRLGLFLHFKTQETENDDLQGPGAAQALDAGELGVERKLYYRELIARFAHHLALNWNLGEENTQTPAVQRAMTRYFHDHDPYRHPVVIHTYPDWQERVYVPLLGEGSLLAGASVQCAWNQVHRWTLRWVTDSARAGRRWVVANDEQGSAETGVPPDPGYAGYAGKTREGKDVGYDLHDIRKLTLWGNLMAGGAGVEYYFGYALPQNDLVCEDWRSRDQSWDYCRIALEFFRANQIPFWEMHNANALIGNEKNDNSKYCLARAGELYLVYLPNGGTTSLNLAGAAKSFRVEWFNPRAGGSLRTGSVARVQGGGVVDLGRPPAEPDEDWVVLVRP